MKANLFFGVSSTNTKQEQKDDKFIYATRQRNLFSNSIESNIDRGLNIINIQSGQKIASWIYDGPLRVENSFWRLEPSQKKLKVSRDAFLLEEGDTIFVSYYTLDKFVADFLPVINTSFRFMFRPYHVSLSRGTERTKRNWRTSKIKEDYDMTFQRIPTWIQLSPSSFAIRKTFSQSEGGTRL